MKEITTKKGDRILLYDTIEEMPCTRYHKFNQLLVIDGSAGGSMKNIQEKIANVLALIDEDKERAKLELKNLSITYSLIEKAIDPKSRAFSAMVHSINGHEMNDITNDGLGATANLVDLILTKGERDSALERLKKKLKKKWPTDSEIEEEQMRKWSFG